LSDVIELPLYTCKYGDADATRSVVSATAASSVGTSQEAVSGDDDDGLGAAAGVSVRGSCWWACAERKYGDPDATRSVVVARAAAASSVGTSQEVVSDDAGLGAAASVAVKELGGRLLTRSARWLRFSAL
jgi:hypothetical protein